MKHAKSKPDLNDWLGFVFALAVFGVTIWLAVLTFTGQLR